MSKNCSWPVLPELPPSSPVGCGGGDADAPRAQASETVEEGAVEFVPNTPSTTCPSYWSAGSPSTPCAHLRQLEPEHAECAEARAGAPTSFKKRDRPAPFASLMLPAWAAELAARTPVDEDFDDFRSWYSASPCSTPTASPRSPIASCAPPPAPVGVSTSRARWADIVEEDEDASGGAWAEFASSLGDEDGGSEASEDEVCTSECRRRWADMSDDDDANDVWR
mmetsp:Transcript_32798/g.93213  ORF Transcript_32798/g.93213 Transcript_32798/m.93213 type:complete len:223 (-) Transcript_32798:156-824(-)